MNDRDIDQLLDAWMELGPNVAPPRVAEAARLEARSTRQTAVPMWTARRFFAMNTMTRVAAAAVVVSLGVALGFGVLGPNVGDVPSPTPHVTPGPLPDDFSPQSATIRNTRVDFALPADDQLELLPSDFAWRIEIRDTSDSWGIKVADVTGATNHTDRFTSEPIPASDAATFLDALNASASYVVSDVGTSTIDGRPALTATIGHEEGAEDDHLDVDGEGGVMFDTPNVIYLVDVDGAIFMIQVWARTEADLAANRPLADSILATLRFAP